MNLKLLLLGVFLLGVSLTALVYNSNKPVLSAKEFIEGCDNKYGYASWYVDYVPSGQGIYVYTCVPQNNITIHKTAFIVNWSAVER